MADPKNILAKPLADKIHEALAKQEERYCKTIQAKIWGKYGEKIEDPPSSSSSSSSTSPPPSPTTPEPIPIPTTIASSSSSFKWAILSVVFVIGFEYLLRYFFPIWGCEMDE